MTPLHHPQPAHSATLLLPSDPWLTGRWGWRVPFLSSLLMGIVAALFRSSIKETEDFKQEQLTSARTSRAGPGQVWAPPTASSFLAVLYVHWVDILLVVAVTAYWCVGYYTCFIWMGYYMSALIGDNTIAHAWELNIIMTMVLIMLMPLGGWLGDWACDFYKCVRLITGGAVLWMLDVRL